MADEQKDENPGAAGAAQEGGAQEAPKILFPLWVKLAITMSLLAAIPVVVVGWGLLSLKTDEIKNTLHEHQQVLVGDITETIDSQFEQAQYGLNAVASALGDSSIAPDRRLSVALTLVESSPILDIVAIYKEDGSYLDAIREVGAPERELAPVLEEALRRRVGSNKAQGEPEPWKGEVRVPMVVPIRAQDRITGYLVGYVSMQRLQTRIDTLSQLRGRTDVLYVIDDTRRVIAHTDSELAESMASMEKREILEGLDGEKFTQGVGRSGEFRTPDNTLMVGSVTPLPENSWAAVAELPASVAYRDIEGLRLAVIASIILSIILAIAAALWLARSQTAPLERMMDFAKKLAQRDFEARLHVDTSDELAVLSHAMNRAASDLADSEAQIRQEQEIRHDLGRYVPKEIVERVVSRDQDMALGGIRRDITVLFADVVRFTPLTEKLPPEDIVALMNELFTILTEIIFRHGGTVDKFIGDSVMAFWGAPQWREDHAQSALEAAEDMMRFLEVGNAGWQEKYGVTIELAVGMNTGTAVVGNIGSSTRMEYTAIGDVVNVAARLEAIAQPNEILVTSATQQAAGEDFLYEYRGQRKMHGRNQPVEIFEVKL